MNPYDKSKLKLKVKEQWFCDKCGEIITDASEGMLQWYNEGKGFIEKGFQIVHNRQRCLYNDSRWHEEGRSLSDMHLDSFIGPDGLAYLLSFFESNRLGDNNELTEIIRRLHVDFYEEARRYWPDAEQDGFFDGANEVWPYLPDTSKRIIKKYAR